MAINVTVFPVEGDAVVYFQDGTNQILEAQTEHQFQIVDGGFVTISDSPEDVDAQGEKFIEMMIEFWEHLWAEIKEETQEPEVNPL